MIPRKLKEAGYVTGCVGKWGLGYPGSVSMPNKMGFDFFYSYNCKWQAHTYYPPFLYRNECREYLENGIVHPDTPIDKGLIWNMMPTMCEIGEVQCPPIDGVSLLPEMLGKKKEQKKHKYLYWEFPALGGQKAVRLGIWKLLSEI